MAKVVSYRITSHTGDDDKDNGNGVVCKLNLNNEIIFDHPEWHKDLTFRDGDDNTWAPIVKKDLDTKDAKMAKFYVRMTGDDGDWISAFSIIGVLDNGTEYQLLSKTNFVEFESGMNNEYEFPLTA